MADTLWENVLNNAVGNLGLCGKLLETINPNVAKEFLGKFENCVEEYCKLDIIHQSTMEALDETKQYYQNEENDLNIPPKKTYDQYFKKIKKPNKSDIENHNLRHIYNREIEEAKSREDMQDDDNIISTNQFVPPTDPISKEPIKNPVRNNICGHIYDRDTITQMIQQRNMRCPYIGCPSKQFVTVDKLESHHELKRKIDRHYLDV